MYATLVERTPVDRSAEHSHQVSRKSACQTHADRSNYPATQHCMQDNILQAVHPVLTAFSVVSLVLHACGASNKFNNMLHWCFTSRQWDYWPVHANTLCSVNCYLYSCTYCPFLHLLHWGASCLSYEIPSSIMTRCSFAWLKTKVMTG